jgi:hypothetical protein
MIQCFAPSVSIIVRYPGGISGGSRPIVRLHTWHGIPAPPQWQASSWSLAPSHGLSGWSSHTQRAPPHTSDVSISPRPLFILIPQTLEFQAHGHPAAVMKQMDRDGGGPDETAVRRTTAITATPQQHSCDRTHNIAVWVHNLAAALLEKTTSSGRTEAATDQELNA